jgi:hypothetical protein
MHRRSVQLDGFFALPLDILEIVLLALVGGRGTVTEKRSGARPSGLQNAQASPGMGRQSWDAV